ncbi:tetratricopeptide repeat protein [Seminibacterium arietis]|uniref:Tetratricopeptide repeat protein n=1 Tax=Seminibacterium arietis TaxID=1173502 RepID=A0ABW3I952_9PAST
MCFDENSADYQMIQLYQEVAEQGDAKAQRMLGLMYYNGKGVEQDYQQAFEWSQKSAEQGDAKVQGMLRMMIH